jgi:hypothetical protein
VLVEAIKWLWGLFWSLLEKIMALIASLFPVSEPGELPPMPGIIPTGPEEEFHFTLPEWLRSSLRLGWTVIMGGFLLFALWRISSSIFRWLRRKLAGTAGAEYESMPRAFRLDFLSFLKRIMRKLLGLRSLFRLRKKEGEIPPDINSIRQIYRHFLRWAASAGHPRYVSQTPQEYCYALEDFIPDVADDLHLVTQLYVRARYGARPSTAEQLGNLNRAWNRVKRSNLKRANPEHKKEVDSGG